jgi:hypothetical protein
LIFCVFFSLLLLLIDGFFFHIFSAWNTTIWEAVWLSLLLLETRCEKVCLFSCFVQSLSVSRSVYMCFFFFFFVVCVRVLYMILILFPSGKGKDLGDSVSWGECYIKYFFFLLFFLWYVSRNLPIFFHSSHFVVLLVSKRGEC